MVPSEEFADHYQIYHDDMLALAPAHALPLDEIEFLAPSEAIRTSLEQKLQEVRAQGPFLARIGDPLLAVSAGFASLKQAPVVHAHPFRQGC